jgi:hypothetical protein
MTATHLAAGIGRATAVGITWLYHSEQPQTAIVAPCGVQLPSGDHLLRFIPCAGGQPPADHRPRRAPLAPLAPDRRPAAGPAPPLPPVHPGRACR